MDLVWSGQELVVRERREQEQEENTRTWRYEIIIKQQRVHYFSVCPLLCFSV